MAECQSDHTILQKIYVNKFPFWKFLKGRITSIRITAVKVGRPLKGNRLKDFKEFPETYVDRIIKKRIEYFVLHKDVEFKRTGRKLR